MTTARPSEAREEVFSIRSLQSIDPSGGDVVLSKICRAIYVGTAGDLALIAVGDSTPVTLKNLSAGMWHPIQAQTISQTGTTALQIVVGF